MTYLCKCVYINACVHVCGYHLFLRLFVSNNDILVKKTNGKIQQRQRQQQQQKQTKKKRRRTKHFILFCFFFFLLVSCLNFPVLFVIVCLTICFKIKN